jgi:hypothetical protein
MFFSDLHSRPAIRRRCDSWQVPDEIRRNANLVIASASLSTLLSDDYGLFVNVVSKVGRLSTVNHTAACFEIRQPVGQFERIHPP